MEFELELVLDELVEESQLSLELELELVLDELVEEFELFSELDLFLDEFDQLLV